MLPDRLKVCVPGIGLDVLIPYDLAGSAPMFFVYHVQSCHQHSTGSQLLRSSGREALACSQVERGMGRGTRCGQFKEAEPTMNTARAGEG
jgi:hypothetical protein